MSYRKTRHALGVAASAVTLVFPLAASAQTATAPPSGQAATPIAYPAAPSDTFLLAPSASVPEHFGFGAGAVASYGEHTYGAVDPATGERRGYVLKQQGMAHLLFDIGLFDRAMLSIDVPLVFLQKGDAKGVATPSGEQFGDARLGARVRLLGDDHGPFALAAQADVFLPTGSRADLTGEGVVRATPALNVSGAVGNFVYAASAGYELRRDTATPVGNIGPGVALRGAVGYRLFDGLLQIGPEIYGRVPTTTNGASPFELVGGVRLHKDVFYLGAAAGSRLGDELTAADFRFWLSAGIAVGGTKDADGDGVDDAVDACKGQAGVADPDARRNGCPRVADRDGDGVPDERDACAEKAGPPSGDPKTNGCPLALDGDGDGVADAADACPGAPGVASNDPKINGCPSDDDGDGVPDATDACRGVAGVATSDAKTNGCPADEDGDGVADGKDACPGSAGVASANPKFDGCPADIDGDGVPNDSDACPKVAGAANAAPDKNGCPAVRIEGKNIVITDKVRFKTGSAEILKESGALLDRIAALLKENPRIKLVEVEGHTDDRGAAKLNTQLSERRATAVVAALAQRGVDKARMKATGAGPARPLVDNTSDANREQNRRVEFHILDPRE